MDLDNIALPLDEEVISEEDEKEYESHILKENIVYKDISYSYNYLSALASGSLNDSA